LALQAISLRRTKQSCSTRRRIEAVERVILNERERRCYTAARDDAKKSLSSATGKSQGHILLRALSTLRQICSHGGSIIDTTPDSQPTRELNICDKCGDSIDTQNDSQQSFHGACGHNMCYECTRDQNGAEDTTLNCTPSACWICQEPVISILEDVQQSRGNQLNSTLMDRQPTTALTSTSHSAKIEKVVANLQKLEQASPANRMEPIKRQAPDLILIYKLTKTQSHILPLDSNTRLFGRSSVMPRNALCPHRRKPHCRATTHSYSPIQHRPRNQNLTPLLWKWFRRVFCLLFYFDTSTDSLKTKS
jgi:hypothetical protein